VSDSPFDLAIIGAGPGGGCLYTGCIPTKTMAAGVGLLRRAQAARLAGLKLDLNENHFGQATHLPKPRERPAR